MVEQPSKRTATKSSRRRNNQSAQDDSPALSEEQLAAIAASVAAAMKMTGASEQQDTPPVAISGPWGAAVATFDRLLGVLGKSAGYLLVLALLAVGWYFFQQQQDKKDEFFRKEVAALQGQRNDSFKLVQDSYNKIANSATSQILNLDKSLELLKKISAEVDESQEERFEQEKALDRAIASAKKAEEDVQRLNRQFEASRRTKENEINEAETKLKKEKRALKAKETDLNQRAGTIGELKDALRTLSEKTEQDLLTISDRVWDLSLQLDRLISQLRAGLAVESSEGLPSTERDAVDELTELKKSLTEVKNLHQYDAWKLIYREMRDYVIDPAEVLRPFAGLDSKLDEEALDRLVGVSERKLVASIQQKDGFGFDFWARVVPNDPDETRTALVGVLEGKDPTGLIRIVFLIIDRGELSPASAVKVAGAQPNDKRVSETQAFLGLAPAFLPDKNDWLNSGVFLTFINPEGEIEVEHEWNIRPDTNETISLSTLFEREMILEDVIWGIPQPFRLLKRDQFEALVRDQRLPMDVRKKLQNPFEEPLLNFEMLARAESADTILSKIDLALIGEPDLREAVDGLVRSVIGKNLTAVKSALGGSKISPKEVVSKLGTFVLRPQFRVADVSIGRPRVAQQQIQRQVSTLAGAQPGKALELQPLEPQAEIILAAAVKSASEDVDLLTLALERSSTDNKWRLIDAVDGQSEHSQLK
jgi:hypothetical protein